MKNHLSVRWASIRDFEIIKTLVEKGSATLAAEELGISQPAVSKAIANIEDKSGKVLFTREKGRLLPTKDALFFYEEILNIFSSLERIEDSNWSKHSSAVIRVITTPTIAYTFLAPLIARYLKDHSNVKISLSVVKSVDIINEIREGKADLAYCNTDINNGLAELMVTPVLKSKVVCLMHRHHELAKKTTISLNDFSYRNVIMYTTRNILSSKLKKLFLESSIEVNVVAEVSDTMLALSLLNENLGLCLAPAFPVNTQIGDNIITKEVDFTLNDEMAAFSLNSLQNPFCSDFVDFIQQQVGQMTASLSDS